MEGRRVVQFWEAVSVSRVESVFITSALGVCPKQNEESRVIVALARPAGALADDFIGFKSYLFNLCSIDDAVP